MAPKARSLLPSPRAWRRVNASPGSWALRHMVQLGEERRPPQRRALRPDRGAKGALALTGSARLSQNSLLDLPRLKFFGSSSRKTTCFGTMKFSSLRWHSRTRS